MLTSAPVGKGNSSMERVDFKRISCKRKEISYVMKPKRYFVSKRSVYVKANSVLTTAYINNYILITKNSP